MWDPKIFYAAHRKVLVVSSVSLVSFASGAGLTFLMLKKRLETKYDELSRQEIASAREFYTNLGTKPSLEELAKEYVKSDAEMTNAVSALRQYQGVSEVQVRETEVTVTAEPAEEVPEAEVVAHNNIFVDSIPLEDEFDYAAEMRNRTEEAPYILTVDEFHQQEKGYQQTSFTWFETDGILIDEADGVVDEDIVGMDNLQKFGHGSRDNNLLFVRNDKLEAEYEIIRSLGDFAQVVHGYIEHSHRPGSGKVPRFRRDDG